MGKSLVSCFLTHSVVVVYLQFFLKSFLFLYSLIFQNNFSISFSFGYKNITARWYTRPKTVTHPSTNRARRALTSFKVIRMLQGFSNAIRRTFAPHFCTVSTDTACRAVPRRQRSFLYSGVNIQLCGQEAQLSPKDRAMRCVSCNLPIATQQCRNYLYDKT